MIDFPTNPRDQLLAYITGAMSRDQRDAFEQRMIDDDDFSACIALAEQELLEDYATNTLTANESQTLGPWVQASPRRMEHIRLTRDLLLHSKRHTTTNIPTTKASARSTQRYLATIGAIAACLFLAAVLFWKLHPHAATPLPQNAHLQLPATPPAAITRIPPDTILLTVERTRGASQPPATYTLHAAAPIRLQFMLPASSKPEAHSLQLRTGSTNSVTHYNNLTLHTIGGMKYLELLLSPNTLPPGSYTAEISGPSGRFISSFRIVQE